MQAISTIIETKEFPYNDDYLWKNNGNTVHKKSGYRSIYYKCSNSAKVRYKKTNTIMYADKSNLTMISFFIYRAVQWIRPWPLKNMAPIWSSTVENILRNAVE